MSAALSGTASPEPGRPPFTDASPAQIRAALIPEEAAEFDEDWRRAMAEAAESLDLTGVFETVEDWRRIAWLTAANGADAHRNMYRRAATTFDGAPTPPDEPLSRTKARLGLQVRVYTVTTDQQSGPQIAALPPQALAPFAELHATLEVAPWNGRTQHRMHPASSMRTMAFGPGSEGLAYYLILDDLRRVDLLSVVWVELPSIQRSVVGFRAAEEAESACRWKIDTDEMNTMGVLDPENPHHVHLTRVDHEQDKPAQPNPHSSSEAA